MGKNQRWLNLLNNCSFKFRLKCFCHLVPLKSISNKFCLKCRNYRCKTRITRGLYTDFTCKTHRYGLHNDADNKPISGCSISQNSASVLFRGYLKFASEFSRGYLNYTSKNPISNSAIFRGSLNSASVILIYPRNDRGFRPLSYTLRFQKHKRWILDFMKNKVTFR